MLHVFHSLELAYRLQHYRLLYSRRQHGLNILYTVVRMPESCRVTSVVTAHGRSPPMSITPCTHTSSTSTVHTQCHNNTSLSFTDL